MLCTLSVFRQVSPSDKQTKMWMRRLLQYHSMKCYEDLSTSDDKARGSSVTQCFQSGLYTWQNDVGFLPGTATVLIQSYSLHEPWIQDLYPPCLNHSLRVLYLFCSGASVMVWRWRWVTRLSSGHVNLNKGTGKRRYCPMSTWKLPTPPPSNQSHFKLCDHSHYTCHHLQQQGLSLCMMKMCEV